MKFFPPLRVNRLTAVATVGILLGCKPADDTVSEAQPNGAVGVTVLDSVRLAETDTAFVARPAGVAVSQTGEIFVADNANKRVYHFTRTGAFIKSISRNGDGPGEVASFGAIALADDSLLVVKNLSRLRLEVFDARTGTHRWGRAVPARTYQVTTDKGTLYTSAPDPASRSSIFSFASETDSIRRAGLVPALLARYPVLVGPFGSVAHDVRAGQSVEAFEVSDYIYRTSTNGADSIFLPKLRRRGAAIKELQATATDTSQGRSALFKSSVPMLVSILTDSTAAIVHSDVELAGNLFKGKYFVSLVNFPARLVCIDLPLPLPVDPMPRLGMVGDTLVAVVQHVDEGSAAGTYLLRMHVDASKCPWNHVGTRR